LNDTVDYVLNKIVVEEMEIRSHLLEHVAQRIITRVFVKFQKFPEYFWRFKINPPIGGDVEAVTVELEEYRS
jgi:dihydroneopterin aldolase